MSKSQRLTLSHARAAFRLVGEAGELGDDVVAWRTRVVEGLMRLVDAPYGIAEEELIGDTMRESAFLGCAPVGWDAINLGRFHHYMATEGFTAHPLFPIIRPIAVGAWTCARRDLLADDAFWYGHRVVNDYFRTSDFDDTIHSRQPIPRRGWSSMIELFRAWGSRPFTVRERRLVHLVHEELAHQWCRPAAPDPADALPRRLGQVVRRLRLGDGEKQVAFHLGLSPQTIHAYVRDLYRRYAVSSRVDLLARLAPPKTARLRLAYETAG